MKVFITGGTGFVGSALTRSLVDEGNDVTILTRRIQKDKPLFKDVRYIEGDPTIKGPWQEGLAGNDAVINLAGALIFKRWNKKNKDAIRDSRMFTTKNLVEGLTRGMDKETLFISNSAVGYYGFRGDEELTEESSPGTDFLADVSREWETAAQEAEKIGLRVIICRLGIVLGKEGGALKMMTPLYRYYLGSPLGSGNQWFSWIHMKDLVNIYISLIHDRDAHGIFNCTAPNPVRNREMTKTLGRVLKKPVFMPSVPGFLIRLIMGEFGDTILKGQRVFPKKLQHMGFSFQFPDLQKALEDILQE